MDSSDGVDDGKEFALADEGVALRVECRTCNRFAQRESIVEVNLRNVAISWHACFTLSVIA